MSFRLTTADPDKKDPIFSCPKCNSENIDANPPPRCKDCGSDGNTYDDLTSWIQCPNCKEREIIVHGTPQHSDSSFRLECGSCKYDVEIIWMSE